jgi:uncharacterized lipoprotein YbaY
MTAGAALVLSLLVVAVPQTAGRSSAADPLVGQVWTATHAAAAPGTIRIFLADGTLLTTSCGETYRLSRWSRVSSSRIAWEEDGARIDADVAGPTAEAVELKLLLKGETRTETYTSAPVPFTCPASRPSPAGDIVASGTAVYMERIALPPTARIRIELRDDSRGDAATRPLAVQNLTARDGPPFRFSLRAPAESVDGRTRLSVFAEITDGERQLFTTRSRYAVPATGARGLDVRLTFVASARGDGAPGLVTPAPAAYRCGEEVFRIAFETGRAYVTMPDRSVVTLQRSDKARDPEAARTYTNGRITFVQQTEGTTGSAVRFARGRRALVTCQLQK